MKYAHYFASRQVKLLILSQGPEPIGFKIIVSGKAEARRVAKQHDAKPYNF